VEVRAARSAEQALDFAGRWKPQLIVFSSRLPGTTALRFCEEVRSNSELGHTKLLMLTDQLGEEAGEEFVAGADAHLVNPVDGSQLFQTIAGLLNIRLREAKRVAVDLIGQIDLLTRNDGEDVKAVVNVLNLSDTGLLIESPVPMSVGSIGRVRFYLPGTSEQLSLYCTVRLLADELVLHYGVEFIMLRAADKDVLREFVLVNSGQ
jgi:CheY-like chemotaxis protein